MPKCHMTRQQSKANRILKDFRLLKQKDIADELGESKQVVSYRLNHVYPKSVLELVKLLDMAGYEIVEREG